jgi:hypothetical protein
MFRMKRFVVLAVASVLAAGVLCVDRAYAQGLPEKTTQITFSKPIRLPGVTLPAGTYRFLHPSPLTSYHVVQVFSQDGNQAYGLFLTIPEERNTAPDQTVVTFKEMPAGSTDTVRTWFYPGEKTGDEFVYSKQEAVDIAKRTHENVLSMPEPTRVNDKGQTSASKPAGSKYSTRFKREVDVGGVRN